EFNTHKMPLDGFVLIFEELKLTWSKRGFPAMLKKMLSTFNVETNLISMPDKQGQRRLSNIKHLSELIGRQINTSKRSPESLLLWIKRQFNKATADPSEDTGLRLETDDDAVKIQTIFTSKGLQYPIVFAPTLFRLNPRSYSNINEFHDEDGKLTITHKKFEDQSTIANERELVEIECELIRQIYVALTRGIHRTVIVALDHGKIIKGSERNDPPEYEMLGTLGKILRLPFIETTEDDSQSIRVDITASPNRFQNIPGIEPAVEIVRKSSANVKQLVTEPITLTHPAPMPMLDTTLGHSSFSTLAPSSDATQENITGSFINEAKNRDSETAEQPGEPQENPTGIFAFPAGAKTGTCWHDIFENLQFDADEQTILRVTEEKLKTHGFLDNNPEERITTTARMVQRVLTTPLPGMNGCEPFTLSAIPLKDIKVEWQFSFSANNGRKTSELIELLHAYPEYAPVADSLPEWNRPIPGGYLTGFLDLMFRKDNRYYILDWKSNRRSGRQEDFCFAGMTEEINAHHYWLQYLIYTVALNRHLNDTLKNYSYDKSFGGIYYIFLRGVDGEINADGKPNGIYADRPPERLIKDLSAILGDF
ncbi:MAG: hypothetical protein GX811_10100, partial [Lentisphaerae bacterium]|nr:hypothetical protein [Lentisphaerota bacterium]